MAKSKIDKMKLMVAKAIAYGMQLEKSRTAMLLAATESDQELISRDQGACTAALYEDLQESWNEVPELIGFGDRWDNETVAELLLEDCHNEAQDLWLKAWIDR